MAILSLCLRGAVLALSLVASANAQPRLALAESEVKAALIYTFLRYTQWPEASDASPRIVCVWREDELDGRLAPIEGRTVNSRRIDLRVVVGAGDLDNCALLYVGAHAFASWAPVMAQLSGNPILTVSDAPGFVGRGGMIELSTADGRVQVRLDPRAIAAARLSVEPRLLRLVEASAGAAR